MKKTCFIKGLMMKSVLVSSLMAQSLEVITEETLDAFLAAKGVPLEVGGYTYNKLLAIPDEDFKKLKSCFRKQKNILRTVL